MAELRDARTEGAHVAGTDSAATPRKARRKGAFPAAPSNSRNPLDVSAASPLHVRPVMTYAELAALGIVAERTLRRLVAIGSVKRAVIRTGRRVRFVVQDLLEELRQGKE